MLLVLLNEVIVLRCISGFVEFDLVINGVVEIGNVLGIVMFVNGVVFVLIFS